MPRRSTVGGGPNTRRLIAQRLPPGGIRRTRAPNGFRRNADGFLEAY